MKEFSILMAKFYEKKEKILKFYRDFASNDALVKELFSVIDESKIIEKPIILISRYDYMFDTEFKKFLQIEYNMVSVSMGSNSQNIARVSQIING